MVNSCRIEFIDEQLLFWLTPNSDSVFVLSEKGKSVSESDTFFFLLSGGFVFLTSSLWFDKGYCYGMFIFKLYL